MLNKVRSGRTHIVSYIQEIEARGLYACSKMCEKFNNLDHVFELVIYFFYDNWKVIY